MDLRFANCLCAQTSTQRSAGPLAPAPAAQGDPAGMLKLHGPVAE